MNNEYFDKNEDICYSKLVAFNDSNHYFTKIDRQPPKSEIDAMATGANNSTYAIELKWRENYDLNKNNSGYFIENDKGFTGDTIFIESHKLTSLYLSMVYDHRLPLYINFFKNGYTTVHNLLTLNKKPEQSKEMKIKSKGYEKFEIAKRYLLPIDDSAIFDDKNNLQQRQN